MEFRRYSKTIIYDFDDAERQTITQAGVEFVHA